MGSGVLKKTGRFQGTGAAKWIPLDFHPRYVRIVNLTSLATAETVESLDGGIKRITAGTASAMTAVQGIKLGDAANPDAMGFFVGTDDVVNKADDDILFVAFE